MQIMGQMDIFFPHCDHVMSSDCWCEPTSIRIMDLPGLGPTRVIEHNDDAYESHNARLAARDRDRLLLVTDFRVSYEPAITRALSHQERNEPSC